MSSGKIMLNFYQCNAENLTIKKKNAVFLIKTDLMPFLVKASGLVYCQYS